MDKQAAAGSRDEWLERFWEAAPELTQEQRAIAVRVLSRAGRPPTPSPEAGVPATPGQPARGRTETQSAA